MLYDWVFETCFSLGNSRKFFNFSMADFSVTHYGTTAYWIADYEIDGYWMADYGIA